MGNKPTCEQTTTRWANTTVTCLLVNKLHSHFVIVRGAHIVDIDITIQIELSTTYQSGVPQQLIGFIKQLTVARNLSFGSYKPTQLSKIKGFPTLGDEPRKNIVVNKNNHVYNHNRYAKRMISLIQQTLEDTRSISSTEFYLQLYLYLAL